MSGSITVQIPIQDLAAEIVKQLRQTDLTAAPAPAPLPEELIGEKELCKFLGVTPPTLLAWRKRGKIPFIQIGAAIRYDKAKVFDALETKAKPRL